MTEPELPPLPHPPHYSANPLDAWEPMEDLWDAAQMQAYATAAVLAERERCAKIADDRDDPHVECQAFVIAAAIRGGETP